MKAERKAYNVLENSIQDINREKISMNKRNIKMRCDLIRFVLKSIFSSLENEDIMTKGSKLFYGGSYYCGTKITVPDEFDIDVLMKLPKESGPKLFSNKPGYYCIQLQSFDANRLEQCYGRKYGTLSSFLDKSNYILPEKVRNWFQSIVTKCLNKFSIGNNIYRMKNRRHGKIIIKIRESGPAVTLLIENRKSELGIDLVPSFEIESPECLQQYQLKPKKDLYNANEFFLVPKSPKDGEPKDYCFWTPSFQKSENFMIRDKYCLKPTLKLLKLLRDELGHKSIKSYYLKTIVMLMLDSGDYSVEFWKTNSLSYVFMKALKYYSYRLNNKEIPFFWNRKKNLLKYISDAELTNISQRIQHIIADVEHTILTNRTQAGCVLKNYFGLVAR